MKYKIMVKDASIRIREVFNVMNSFLVLSEMPYFHWFLFGSKPSIEVNAGSFREMYLTTIFLERIFSYVMKNKVYSFPMETSTSYKIFFSKKKVKEQLDSLISKENITSKLGKIYGYPSCCIEAYCKDSDSTGSFESVVRYRRQCKKLRMKDAFGVNFADSGENVGYLRLGFIPCSPKCPHALKVLKEYQKIQEALRK